MASQTRWQDRKTLIDIYHERDRVDWYWRMLATLAAALILIGFLVFPTSFAVAMNTQASSGTLSIVAVILLALGYSLSVALWFIESSWLFQLDVLFVPCLTSCVIGGINLGISIGVHPAAPNLWSPSSIAAIVLALISSLIYSVLGLLTLRKINVIRTYDRTATRQRGASDSIHLLPEDELQRQQLLRLLVQQKESNRTSPSQSTFQIGLPQPNSTRSPNSQMPQTSYDPTSVPTSHLAAPSATYEGRGHGIGALSLDDQFTLMRGNVHEDSVDSRQAALDAARAREREAQRSREYNTGTPPIIVNTRVYGDDISDIPLSERHPLERGEFVRGRKSKDEPYREEGVYRPESGDYSGYEDDGPTYQLIEGEQIEVDLERGVVRPGELDDTARRELDSGVTVQRSRQSPTHEWNMR